MELQQLRYFVAVAETGSFVRGARRSSVSQPALSQQVAKLERELKQRLFDRLGRTIALTQAGRALLPRAKRVLSELEEITPSVASEVKGGGQLAVGAIPTISPYLLPAALDRVLREFPTAQLVVREDYTDALLQALIENELEVCVCSLPLDDRRVSAELLFTEPYLVAAAPGHRFARRTQVSIADLDDEPAVMLNESHCLTEQVQALCRARRVVPRLVCCTSQMATVQELVALGLGVAVVPAMCAADDRSGRCVYRPLAARDSGRPIAAVRRAGREESMLAKRFIDLLRAVHRPARKGRPS